MSNTPDFDALYRADPDPFGVGTRWYEVRKRALVMACLSRSTYRLAWDAAAGTGHLARDLAYRCDAVIASDASAVAVAALTNVPSNATGAATALPPGVTALHSALPAIPEPARSADLAVVSEVLYYLDDDARAATAAALASLQAEIVCVQWRHHPEDAYISGEAADAELASRLAPSFRRVVHHAEPDFLISTFLPSGQEPPR